MRRSWIATCALTACAAACGTAPPPERSARPADPAPWRPSPGTPMFECARPNVRDCAYAGPEACEAACGDGDAPSCVGLAGWRPKGEGEGLPRGRAAELLALACRLGSSDGCYRLVTERRDHATKRDLAAAYAALQHACERDPGCGCAVYASALTFDDRRAREGLALLDATCVRGALQACDEAQLLADLCSTGPRSEACDVLRRQRRVPDPPPEPPQWSKVRLPAQLTGCFRVVHEVEHPDGLGLSQVRGSSDAEQGEPAPGTMYCFADDRFFVKPPGGAWDQVQASWSSTVEATELRNDVQGTGVRSLVLSKGEMLVAGDDLTGRIERLPPREADEALMATSALPRVEDVCRRALRCAESSRWGYDGLVPVNLSGCLALERQYAPPAEDPLPRR